MLICDAYIFFIIKLLTLFKKNLPITITCSPRVISFSQTNSNDPLLSYTYIQ